MRYRKLRIAWSILCGIICVPLIVLWARSYKTADIFTLPITANKLFGLSSDKGVFLASFYAWPRGPMVGSIWDRWHGTYEPGPRIVNAKAWNYGTLPSGSSGWYIQMPQMQFIVAAMFLAGASWIRWRFSIRTLLIAMTVLAAVLGMMILEIKYFPATH
jgi:hypothetical protein